MELEEWTIVLHGAAADVNISMLHPPFLRFHPTLGGGRALWRPGAEAHTQSVDALR